ncbi:FadR/GntR family transcriptional regulator [Pontibacillus yanchengensis]|uniref:Transcriptional regulator n=1 Tax=Pontibacillus yanchengensis Y32 TaxID=1385514 RepID=A0A0A2TIJ3_9BACI|nr:FadR/GntR family transcriptional regulator [Pontibacillus yanchengensis]KGP74278.1 transcriptional regulator [Pontibacillus yanchengensis Y32]
MPYKQIRTRKIYEEVADSLLEMLQKGELKPGDKLDSVEQLSKNFSVGRSAVREALSALRATGILEMRQGEGTFVKQFDPTKFSIPVSIAFIMNRKDIKELMDVRKILEVGAVATAAFEYKEEDLPPIQAALDDMRNANDNGELGEKADLDFHLAIAQATHNQMLINLMNSVSEIMMEAMREARKLWFDSETRTYKLLEEHKLIYDAIEKRDSDKAQELMLYHLTQVEEALFQYID